MQKWFSLSLTPWRHHKKSNHFNQLFYVNYVSASERISLELQQRTLDCFSFYSENHENHECLKLKMVDKAQFSSDESPFKFYQSFHQMGFLPETWAHFFSSPSWIRLKTFKNFSSAHELGMDGNFSIKILKFTCSSILTFHPPSLFFVDLQELNDGNLVERSLNLS
jgi:hypothetical protein